MKLRN
jgi:hypothetical protein